MSRPRLLIFACWTILILLAGLVAGMGVGMVREARAMRAEQVEGAPATGPVDPQMMLFQQLARQKREDHRAAQLEIARQRQTGGWMLVGLSIVLAGGWTLAAWLLWNSPRIVGTRPRQKPDPLL